MFKSFIFISSFFWITNSTNIYRGHFLQQYRLSLDHLSHPINSPWFIDLTFCIRPYQAVLCQSLLNLSILANALVLFFDFCNYFGLWSWISNQDRSLRFYICLQILIFIQAFLLFLFMKSNSIVFKTAVPIRITQWRFMGIILCISLAQI